MIEHIVALVAFIIDRFLKYDIGQGKKWFAALNFTSYKGLYDFTTLFNLLADNKLVAYGIGITLFIGVLFFLDTMQKKQLPGTYLLCAGGISNLIDRFWYGTIINYAQCSRISSKLLLFNVADFLIIIGTGILLFSIIKRH